MKRFLLSAFLCVLVSTIGYAQVFESNGLYFKPNINEPGVSGEAEVVKNPSGEEYTGSVYIPGEVVDPATGTVCNVYRSDRSAFMWSSVTDVIFGIKPVPGKVWDFSFSEDDSLEKMQFMHLVAAENKGVNNIINVGYKRKCIELFVRTDGDKRYLIVNKFNLFDADGKQLKPRLCIEVTGEFIEPDENNTFVLDENWRHDGQYCIVMPLGANDILAYIYGVDDKGNYVNIRTLTPKERTGLSVSSDGVEYAVLENAVVLTGSEEGKEFSGDVVIPATVEYAGKEYPVVKIAEAAFEGSAITSVVVPPTVTEIGYGAFKNCEQLEKADISQCGALVLSRTFVGCKALAEIRVPEGSRLSYAVEESGMYSIETVTDNEDVYEFRLATFNVFDIDGNVLPVRFRCGKTYAQENNGIYKFDRKDLYYTTGAGTQRYSGYIVAEFGSANQSRSEDYLNPLSTYFEMYVEEYSGIDEVAVPCGMAEEEWYNLQGVRVAPGGTAPGVYIVRQADKVRKVIRR